jgi:hypothetical protein
MKNYGLTSVSEFLEDRVVYRNLTPPDPRLPGLDDVRPRLGLPQGLVPRKTAPEYAQVIVHLLRAARALDAPSSPIERLVYLGDTPMNDGTAFANICRAGDWPGLAFIGADRDQPAKVDISEGEQGTLYVANRWAAIADFAGFCRKRGFALDERAAVIVDLDKTAVGARGRNDKVIDRARVEAVRRTVGTLLGDDFDPGSFQEAYDLLNQLEYHPFTADNQDYLAYICLILGSGLYDLEPLTADVRAGELTSFQQFISLVDARADELPSSLHEIHEGVYSLVQQGDPTPFKAFRYNEYDTTIQAMGFLADDAPVEDLLAREIVVTQEVRELALAWQGQGALLFGLSDKPDEASVPRPERAAEGLPPIHRARTHSVGGA